MFTCPICGEVISAEDRFCPKCHTVLDNYEDSDESWYVPDEKEYSYNTAYSPDVRGQSGSVNPTPAYVYQTGGPESPLTVSAFLGSIIAMSLPLLGLIIQIIWACGGAKNLNRRRMARAYLILSAIGIVILFLFLIYATPYILELLEMIAPYLA